MLALELRCPFFLLNLQLQAQQIELQSLRCALDAAYAKRAVEAEEAARVSTALNQSVKQVGWTISVKGDMSCSMFRIRWAEK